MQVTDHIDTLMVTLPSESTNDDEVYSSLQQLRADLVRGVPSASQNLANVTEVSLKATNNTLAFTYDLYGSLELEDDIISRNDISNPAFVPAQINLKVLDRG